MKRLFAVLIAAYSLSAATWDKDYGPFQVVTFQFSSGTGTNLPGVPIVPGQLVWHTNMFLKVSEPTVTAFRVQITTAQGPETRTVDVHNGFAACSFAVKTNEIISAPVITPLRDGTPIRLQ